MTTPIDILLTRLAVLVAPHVDNRLSPKLVSLLDQRFKDSRPRTDMAPEAQSAHWCGVGVGGPLGPIPRSFRMVPHALRSCEPLPAEEEVTRVRDVRRHFQIEGNPDAWMNDIIRAFRLITGMKIYIEVGIEDRGNLAYVSTLLSDDALIVGVDIQENRAQDDKLRNFIKPTQTYVPIVGDSRFQSTLSSVKDALQGRFADAVFIDGNHIAHSVLCDYTNYEELVQNDGIIFFHDALWEGDGLYKGVADTLAEINTVDPVYLIDGDNPPRRFMRQLWKGSLWGVVGVVFAREQRWRQKGGATVQL